MVTENRRYVRGDINIILNGMIASGTIGSYKTTFDFDWRFHAGDVENGQTPARSRRALSRSTSMWDV